MQSGTAQTLFVSVSIYPWTLQGPTFRAAMNMPKMKNHRTREPAAPNPVSFPLSMITKWKIALGWQRKYPSLALQ
ncbi:hypothetical protein AAKU55_004291 [Oxalobacteraceae bacterium GrIS 1.11]